MREVHEEQGTSLFEHNRKFLMRAFPSGMRVTSSNLDPTFYWRQGIQMVALNWQSWDKGMMLNEGMFAGEEGWVKKPRGFLGQSHNATDEVLRRRGLDLSIEVFAGQNIPLPIEDKHARRFHPYVKFELHVERPEERLHTDRRLDDTARHADGFKRQTKTSKGQEPDFMGEKLIFSGVNGVIEELSFLR